MTARHLTLTLLFCAFSLGSCKADGSQLTNDDSRFFLTLASGPRDVPEGTAQPAAQATPLLLAIIDRDKKRVADLLEKGASPNSLIAPGAWSPLMVAAAIGDKDIVAVLLRHGANINYVAMDGMDGFPLAAALNYAIPRQDFAVFNQLLDAGADVNVAFGRTGSSYDIAIDAATLGQMKILNQLLARGYNRDLSGLLDTLQARIVDDVTQAEKDKAIATVRESLKMSAH